MNYWLNDMYTQEDINTIHNNVTMSDLFSRYGFKQTKHFICCPFHGEKTASLQAYRHDTKFRCFGCGASGDVIDFVARLFNLDFNGAVRQISDDFSLCLNGQDMTAKERQEAKQKQRERQKQLEAKRQKQEESENLYFDLMYVCDKLKDKIRLFEKKRTNFEFLDVGNDIILAYRYVPEIEHILDTYNLKERSW